MDLEVRAIAGGPQCSTRKLRNFTYILLKPFLKHIRSYIKDFLNKCQRETEYKTVIATFDVVSLHASIPHDLGLQVIGHFLTDFSNDLHPLI